jgi:hypothetical protein
MATKIQNRARVRMGELIRFVRLKRRQARKQKLGLPLALVSRWRQRLGSQKTKHEAKAMSRVPAAKREEMIARLAVTDRLRPIQRQRKKNLSLIWD